MLKNIPNRGVMRNGYQWPYITLDEFKALLNTKHKCVMCNTKGKIRKSEHVISDWILNYCDAFNGQLAITDHGRQPLDFKTLSTHKIRICTNCNIAFGGIYESQLAPKLKGGYELAKASLAENPSLIFSWANYIVFKNSFVELDIKKQKDLRRKSGFLGDDVNWDFFHTVHAKARAPLYNTLIHSGVIGTMKIYDIIDYEKFGNFYYFDDPGNPIFYIRIKNLAIICMIDDFGFVGKYLAPLLNDLSERLTIFQLTEVFSEMHLARRRMEAARAIRHSFDIQTEAGAIESLSGKAATLRKSSQRERKDLLSQHLLSQLRCSASHSRNSNTINQNILYGNSSYLNSKYNQNLEAAVFSR